MASNAKTLETAKGKLTQYVAMIESTRKCLESCIKTITAHEAAGETLEDEFTAMIAAAKASSTKELTEAQETKLKESIKKWSHSQASLELDKASGVCKTQLNYLLTALKEVPKVT